MRVRKLLWRRMVMTEFADRGLFGPETGSANKRLPGRDVSGVECGGSGADATPSRSRRGLKLRLRRRPAQLLLDATPARSRRGLKRYCVRRPRLDLNFGSRSVIWIKLVGGAAASS